MKPRTLPALTRSVQWLLLPIPILILYASWGYLQEGLHWSAGLQFLLLGILPLAYTWLGHLPKAVRFDTAFLYVTTKEERKIPLHDVQWIDGTFSQLNQRPVFQLYYSNAADAGKLYVLGGRVLADFATAWQQQNPNQ